MLAHTNLSLSRSLSRSLSLDLLRGRPPPRSYLQRTTQHSHHRHASQLHIPTSCTSSSSSSSSPLQPLPLVGLVQL